MSDESFDPCECLWSHDMGVQRLLSILRQTQAYCADNECFNISRLPGPRDIPYDSNLLMISVIFGVVALLYAFRPNSFRQPENILKARNEGPDSNNDPPTPPPAIN